MQALQMTDSPLDAFNRAPNPRKLPIFRTELPHNLFLPEGAESVDLRATKSIAAGDKETLLSFKAPVGKNAVFYTYALSSDDITATGFEFIPEKEGNRVLKYHGSPGANDNIFRLTQALGTSLRLDNTIQCQIFLNPAETFSWRVINSSANARILGVRIIGYVDALDTKTRRSIG